MDDSIARVDARPRAGDAPARGYAPLPVDVGWHAAADCWPWAAHLKNTVAMAAGSQVFISQHIGDLDHQRSQDAFREAVASLERLLQIDPEVVVADAHPDYASTALRPRARDCRCVRSSTTMPMSRRAWPRTS